MKFISSQSDNPDSVFNSDPFLDIVANSIGALFFVLIYVALSAFSASGKLNTPILRETRTYSVIIECRNNTVFYPQIDSLRKSSGLILNSIIKGKKYLSYSDLDEVKQIKISNNYYTNTVYSQIDQDGTIKFLDIIAPIPFAKGESEKEIVNIQSKFMMQLNSYDPNNNHIFFYVRNDSFEVFHLARKLAMQKGFRTGWEPMKKESNIIYGLGGGFSSEKVY